MRYPLPEELGNPAKIDLTQEATKIVYTAEMVEIEEIGQSSWIKETLKSPRQVYQARTVRQRGSAAPELIGVSINYDPAVNSFWDDILDVGTPWLPSITVGGGYVWVLFTRNAYASPDFTMWRTKVDDPGRPVFKRHEYKKNDENKETDSSKLQVPFIRPHFDDNWEDEMFMKYEGRFQIKSCSNGVLVMGAPVLLVASCVKAQMDSLWDTEFKVASSNHQIDPKIYPKPVHYKELMKNKEVIIKYHIEKNAWSLEVPDGFAYPRKKPGVEAEE